MDKAQRDHLISMLPQTEYGIAFFDWIQEEIDSLEEGEMSNMNIVSHGNFLEDMRIKMAIKTTFKRVKRKPQEILDNQQRRT